MRLQFNTYAEAQVVCDRIFAEMTAAGKLEPHTTGWAIPYQDLTEAQQAAKAAWNPVVKEGEAQPIYQVKGPWFVTVKDRCAIFLRPVEVDAVPELRKAEEKVIQLSGT